MTPAQLDLLVNGAFIYERPDGSRYATWSNMARFGVDAVSRSGPLTADDLAHPATEVLARINEGLGA